MISNITLPLQKLLLLLNTLQLRYLSFSYFSSATANQFPVLERLFKPEMTELCTPSGCWQSIVPFLGSTYASIALISIFGLFFRANRELRLLISGLASVHIVMGIVRLNVVPESFYLEGAAMNASLMQFAFGGMMLVSALLPYKQNLFLDR